MKKTPGFATDPLRCVAFEAAQRAQITKSEIFRPVCTSPRYCPRQQLLSDCFRSVHCRHVCQLCPFNGERKGGQENFLSLVREASVLARWRLDRPRHEEITK